MTDLDGKKESKGFYTIGPGKTFVAGRTRDRTVFYYGHSVVYGEQRLSWGGDDPKKNIVLFGKSYPVRVREITRSNFGNIVIQIHCDNVKK